MIRTKQWKTGIFSHLEDKHTMAKIIAYDEEARQGMLQGLDKLANTVR